MNKLSISKTKDIYIYDDSKKYIDTRFGAGTFILGHTKEFNKKIYNQIDKGTLFGYHSENEEILRLNLKKQINWFDDFIFCNSGSESIMRAFRIARSYTKKKKIAIASSFWHGGYDGTQIRSDSQNEKILNSSGVNQDLLENLILIPNNDIKNATKILDENKNNLAMVFFEPVQQLVPRINKDYIQALRDYTKNNDILLGFDEMISGFRMAVGGAQEYLNIYSDIVCYGKIIGGGYAIGVVGYNKEISEHLKNVKPTVRFGGTFSGNPLSTFTGNLILNYLVDNKEKLYLKLDTLTKKLCDTINDFCKENNYAMRFYYASSFYRILFTDKYVETMEERAKHELDRSKQIKFFNILKVNKLLTAQNPLSFISNKHNEENVIEIIDIYKKSITKFFTIIKSERKSTKNYIFKDKGEFLEYIATEKTFDEIYKNIEDPWDQSNKNDQIYLTQRNNLNDVINLMINKFNFKIPKILETGSGTGMSTNFLKENINNNIEITGSDISKNAVQKASNNYPDINFFVYNIKNKLENKKYDIVIFSNLLWYILDDYYNCFKNGINLLNENGIIIITQVFLKKQKFGINFEELIQKITEAGYLNVEYQEKNIKEFENDYRYLGILVISKLKFNKSENQQLVKMNSNCIILYGSILNDKDHLERRLIYYKKFFKNIIFITYEILVIEYNVKDILLKYVKKENLILIPSNRTGKGIENATKYTPFQITEPQNTFFYDGSLADNYMETDLSDKRRKSMKFQYIIFKYFQNYGKKYEYYFILRNDDDKSLNHKIIEEMISKAKKNKIVLYSSRPINQQKKNCLNSKNNFYIKQPGCGKDTMYIGFNLNAIFSKYETIYNIYDTLWKNINDLNYKMLNGDGEGWFLTKYILIKENKRFIEEEFREKIVYKYCDFLSEDGCFWTHRYHITWGKKLGTYNYKLPCLYCRRSDIFERKIDETCPNLLFGFKP
jgi:glutamate-1-semialdehyde 2,1-aminomutase